MKRCPYCGAENHDTAVVCYNCGQDLSNVPVAGRATEPTQPLRPARGNGPTPGAPSGGAYPPSPYDTQPMPPYSPQTPPYNPPSNAQPTTYTRVSYPPPPPPNPEPPRRGGSCAWGLAGALLGLALVCILGLVVLSFTGAGTAIASRLRGQTVTQAANPFAIPTATPALPEETPLPEVTATPASEEPTPTLSATQQAYLDKLLSPGCRSALDTLGTDSNTITQNPLTLLDDTFRSGFTQALNDMRTNCGSLDAASPIPGKVGEINQDIAQANAEFDQANQLWTEAVDQRDPSKAIQAAQHVGAAAQSLGKALSGIKDIAP